MRTVSPGASCGRRTSSDGEKNRWCTGRSRPVLVRWLKINKHPQATVTRQPKLHAMQAPPSTHLIRGYPEKIERYFSWLGLPRQSQFGHDLLHRCSAIYDRSAHRQGRSSSVTLDRRRRFPVIREDAPTDLALSHDRVAAGEIAPDRGQWDESHTLIQPATRIEAQKNLIWQGRSISGVSLMIISPWLDISSTIGPSHPG